MSACASQLGRMEPLPRRSLSHPSSNRRGGEQRYKAGRGERRAGAPRSVLDASLLRRRSRSLRCTRTSSLAPRGLTIVRRARSSPVLPTPIKAGGMPFHTDLFVDGLKQRNAWVYTRNMDRDMNGVDRFLLGFYTVCTVCVRSRRGYRQKEARRRTSSPRLNPAPST